MLGVSFPLVFSVFEFIHDFVCLQVADKTPLKSVVNEPPSVYSTPKDDVRNKDSSPESDSRLGSLGHLLGGYSSPSEDGDVNGEDDDEEVLGSEINVNGGMCAGCIFSTRVFCLRVYS